ncbi:MAG TPA: type II secretion system F family protein, partial [Nitrospirota bacterium]|nr:type II secretion system F family protein [Nitrospirota bacterium]
MPYYQYKALDKHGKVQTGTVQAAGREAVADQLTGAGYIPVQIQEQEENPLSRPAVMKRFSRVRPYDLIIFSRQLATLVGAGVPFLQALTSLEKQTKNRRLRETVSEIKREVEAGAAFSEALAKHPAVFSTMYVSMVRAGETAGILEEILERLALLAEHDYETRARMKAAVRYPFIVLITLCVAFAFLVSFVIPRFASVFERFKTALPFPTRVLIAINHIVQHYWYAVLLVAALIIGGVLWYLRTPAGRRQWDRVKLRIPVFGGLLQKVAMSRFARIFSVLQKSGISMLLTLDIAAETVGNVVIARAIGSMRESVREGRTLS